jgi:sporulation protein YlmC with PRC-barrel domain
MRRCSIIVLVAAIIAAVLGYSSSVTRDKSDMMKASNVIGMQVVGSHGKYLGKINDLVVNPDGDIVYALIDLGGVLRTGEKYVAVPGDALRSSDNGTKIVLNTTFDEFYKAARLGEDTKRPS